MKIPAATFIQFGTGINPASEIGQFGSYPSPEYTINIYTLMSGTSWERGWFGETINTNRPFIQDFNAIDYAFSYFLAYTQQMGLGEYVSTTIYDINSIVQVAGQIYISLQTSNQGKNPATSPTWWQAGLPGAEVSGAVKAYAGVVAPTGYLLCDGSAISRTTYAALFVVCGTAYGVGDGSTTFNIPDLRTRVPVGYLSGDPNFGTIGDNGGEVTHTLTIGEMPSHNHTGQLNASPQSGNSTNCADQSGGQGPIYFTTNNTGGDAAHNNLQPYITMNYIIKT